MTTWRLESDGTLSKTTLTYPEQTEDLSPYVKIAAGNRTLVLRTKCRPGASGDLLRVSKDLKIGPTAVTSLEASRKFRFRLFWLFHSPYGILGIVALLCLTVGTVLTGEVEIRASAANPAHFQLNVQAWTGLVLSGAAIILSGIRDFFTDAVANG
jgi:hypothetical protein